jgi:hypothetical protein
VAIEKSLTSDQRHTLARLQLLLRRRCLATSTGIDRQGGRVAELVHALDTAIVGSYRLARALEVGDEADALLAGFRAAQFVPGAWLEGSPDGE